MEVLLLCTANQCRSPMAEALLRKHFTAAGVDAAVASAGVYEGGAPATDHGRATMAERGIDIEEHRSRRVTADMVERADLIIGMAREHVREAAVLEPTALVRAFTLKELARGAQRVGPRGADEALGVWLGRIAGERRGQTLLGVGHDDELDVADPVGGSRSNYDDTADLLDELLARVTVLAFPQAGRQERTA